MVGIVVGNRVVVHGAGPESCLVCARKGAGQGPRKAAGEGGLKEEPAALEGASAGARREALRGEGARNRNGRGASSATSFGMQVAWRSTAKP